MIEIWKDIENFKNYQVSNLGNVRSLDRVEFFGCHTRIRKGTLFTPQVNRDGYLKVGIRQNGKYVLKSIHRLVAEAFLPNENNLPQVNHKNGNKQDNTVSNLEWISAKDNCIHAIKTNLYQTARGESSNRSHLTESDIIKIREIYQSIKNYCEVARIFKISEATARAIIKRETWRHIA